MKKFRNHGIGSALCAPILTAADAEGLPCYLDTANPKSIPFFKRLGFRASKKNKSVGPDFWAMQRAPQPTKPHTPLKQTKIIQENEDEKEEKDDDDDDEKGALIEF